MKHATSPARELAGLAPFSECADPELHHLDHLSCPVTVPPGTILARQGGAAREYVVIVDGRADELLDGRPVSVLGRGDDFGGRGLLQRSPHRSTIVAGTPMQLQVMSSREFRSAYDTVPSLQHHVDDEVARVASRWCADAPSAPEPEHAARSFDYTLAS